MYSRGKKAVASIVAIATCLSLSSFVQDSEAPATATEMNLPADEIISLPEENIEISNISIQSNTSSSHIVTDYSIQSQADEAEGLPVYSIDGSMLLFATLNSELLEKLYSAPSEILSAPTMDLLEYFLQSFFMQQIENQGLYRSSCMVPERNLDENFFYNEAFVELISREDLLTVLETYAEQLTHSSVTTDGVSTTDCNTNAFKRFIEHDAIATLITQSSLGNPSSANSCLSDNTSNHVEAAVAQSPT